MAKYDPNAERLGSQAMALQRMAYEYPDEYRRVCKMRQAHAILFNLPADKFDRILVESLHVLVREGVCKRPQRITFNQH